MKYIMILAISGLIACTPAPTELPADFDPAFSF